MKLERNVGGLMKLCKLITCNSYSFDYLTSAKFVITQFN